MATMEKLMRAFESLKAFQQQGPPTAEELVQKQKKDPSTTKKDRVTHCLTICENIVAQSLRPYLVNLLPCLTRISKRPEEAVQETLAAAIPKVMAALGNFANDLEIKVLLKSFVGNLKSSSPTIRRTAASSAVSICQHSRRTQYFYTWLLSVLLGLMVPVEEEHPTALILGVLLTLRYLMPLLQQQVKDTSLKGSFGVTRKEAEVSPTQEQLVQVYELTLHYTQHHDHNVVTAALELLQQTFRTPPSDLLHALITAGSMPQVSISREETENRSRSGSILELIGSVNTESGSEIPSSSGVSTLGSADSSGGHDIITEQPRSCQHNLQSADSVELSGASEAVSSTATASTMAGGEGTEDEDVLSRSSSQISTSAGPSDPSNLASSPASESSQTTTEGPDSAVTPSDCSELVSVRQRAEGGSQTSTEGPDVSPSSSGDGPDFDTYHTSTSTSSFTSDSEKVLDGSESQYSGMQIGQLQDEEEEGTSHPHEAPLELFSDSTLARSKPHLLESKSHSRQPSDSSVDRLIPKDEALESAELENKPSRIKGEIGHYTDQNAAPLVHCVRLLSASFLLNGQKNGLVPDKEVRVSVKALAVSCVGAAAALHPEAFFNKLYRAPLEGIEPEEQQYISDILKYIDHGDPQIRGATAILCGTIIYSILNKTRFNVESWLANVKTSTGNHVSLVDCVPLLQKTLKDESSVTCKLACTAVRHCIMTLCSSSFSALGLQLLVDLLTLRNSSYWLLLKLQDRVLNDVIICLLGDEDPRVRHVAATTVTSLSQSGPTDDFRKNCTVGMAHMVLSLLSSAWFPLDLSAHQDALMLTGNLLAAAAPKSLKKPWTAEEEANAGVNKQEEPWPALGDRTVVTMVEQLFSHLMKILNICAHVIDDVAPGPAIKASLPSLSNTPSLSPIRRKGKEKEPIEQNAAPLSPKKITDTSPARPADTAGATATNKSSTLGSFYHLPPYLKLFDVTLDLQNNTEKFGGFLRSALDVLSQLLELATLQDIGKCVEEILGYLKSCFCREPTMATVCVQQLLKTLFGTNLASQYEGSSSNTSKSQGKAQRLGSSNLRLGLYHYCFMAPYTHFTQALADASLRNMVQAEHEQDASGWFDVLQNVSTQLKSNISNVTRHRADKNAIHNHIRLFEPLVIKALKQYTTTTSVYLQRQVLDLLAQLVQLRVNYCLLDSDQVFIGFVLKQFEYIEVGQFRDSEAIVPNIFFFLVLLSYERYHSKQIIGIPKIIQLCDGIMASGRKAVTHAIPALQPIVHDLFVLRGSNKADAGKELETQKEVVVLEMFILVLQQCHKENEDKWKRLSRQIADIILPMLAKQQCSVGTVQLWISGILAILRVLISQSTEDIVLSRIQELSLSPYLISCANIERLRDYYSQTPPSEEVNGDAQGKYPPEETFARRHSLSSTKLLSPHMSDDSDESKPESKLAMCNREIVRRGALILFSDYVCQNLHDSEHLAWLIVNHVRDLINLSHEPPVQDFISAIHRNSAASGLFIQAIQSRCENLSTPTVLKKTLQCLEGIHLSQSGAVLMLYVDKFINTPFRVLARMVDTLACRRIEMLLAETLQVWKLGWSPKPGGEFGTAFPEIPVEFLQEKDVFREFLYRVNTLGWTSRTQFEETWASLLGVLVTQPIVMDHEENQHEEDLERTQINVLAVQAITSLVLSAMTIPVAGNPAVSCLEQQPRNKALKALDTRFGRKLSVIRGIVEQEIQAMVSKRDNIATHYPYQAWDPVPSLSAAATGTLISHEKLLLQINTEREMGNMDYKMGQVSIHSVWLGNSITPLREEEWDEDEEEESDVPAPVSPPTSPINSRKHRAGVDIHSCSQFLLELYSQWILPNNPNNKKTPVILISEVVRSLLAVSDLFTERNQYEMMYSTLTEMQKVHPTEDEILNQYLVPAICKAASVLGMDKAIAEPVSRLLETTLRSTHMPSRIGALHGILYVLECDLLDDTAKQLIPIISDYLLSNLRGVAHCVNLHNQQHVLVMCAAAFYMIENYPLDVVPEFTAGIIQMCGVMVSGCEDSTPSVTYHCVLRGLERLLLSEQLSRPDGEALVKLSVDRVNMPSPHRAMSALGLMLTCMYTGKEKTSPSRTSDLDPTAPDSESVIVAMERVSVLFDRIRKGFPCEARVVARILPQFLDDFFPPQDVMNKVIGEFLSNQQPYPQFMATVVYKVFQTLHATGQSSMVRDWVMLSLSNFTQRTPVSMAMWSLSCFFVSASTSQWISALLPHVISRMGKSELVDVSLFCVVGMDFYKHQIDEELDRRAFQSVFEVVASPGSPYHRLLTCLQTVPQMVVITYSVEWMDGLILKTTLNYYKRSTWKMKCTSDGKSTPSDWPYFNSIDNILAKGSDPSNMNKYDILHCGPSTSHTNASPSLPTNSPPPHLPEYTGSSEEIERYDEEVGSQSSISAVSLETRSGPLKRRKRVSSTLKKKKLKVMEAMLVEQKKMSRAVEETCREVRRVMHQQNFLQVQCLQLQERMMNLLEKMISPTTPQS
ncbi:Huntingtin [Acipenser ruthenus]|uniref:Huntingtin n=1 Tax=Acipenser ruthenus TaxID=7906 RepID=A0A444TZF7_ACIRT|nr:Huntingtin [Acipenser ruthenus]